MGESVGRDLAARGLAIFGGSARGVDAAARRGAVFGKAKAVAVFGTGTDAVYPKEKPRLGERF